MPTPVVDFLPFATGAGANVEAQATWIADPVVTAGFSSGIAPSAGFNKAWRQPSFIGAGIANYMAEVLQANVSDNANLAGFVTQLWQALLTGGAFTDVGAVNALLTANPTSPLGLTFPAPTAGLQVTVKASATNTGAATFNWMGTGNHPITFPDGYALQGGEIQAGGYVTLIYSGTSWQIMNVYQPEIIRWDASSPPSSDILLPAGRKAIITFTDITSLPLKIATASGQFYEIKQAVYACSATNQDWALQPNNTSYSGAFASHAIEASDGVLSAFGSASSIEGFTLLTSNVNGYVSQVANVDYFTSDYFKVDLFYGPSVSDTINDIGPSMLDWQITTYTQGKSLRTVGGITGGGSVCFALWNDTITPWTSLGTLFIAPGGAFTGALSIERIA